MLTSQSRISSETAQPALYKKAPHATDLQPADRKLKKLLVEKTKEQPDYWSLPTNDRRAMAHALFQYPAMMVPEVQRRLIAVIRQVQPSIKTLYDPFVGSGTSLVAGLQNGLLGSGQDVNPLAILISKVKTKQWDLSLLSESANVVLVSFEKDRRKKTELAFSKIDKWFRPDVQVVLTKLRRAILKQSAYTRPFFWVVFAETVRLTSNDRTSTYKLHARTLEETAKREIDAFKVFQRLLERSLTDLQSFSDAMQSVGDATGSKWPAPQLVLGDSRMDGTSPTGSVQLYDLLVTSPPYGDNRTTVPYGEHSYLALQWIPLEEIASNIPTDILRTTREIDRRSLGGDLEHDQLNVLVADLTKQSPTLGKMLKKVAAGPDQAVKRVATFYRDLNLCLDKALAVMAPNAYLCWTVASRRVSNIEIRIDKILRELLSHRQVVYITSVERCIHNKRMPAKNPSAATMKLEQIMIFRKAGK